MKIYNIPLEYWNHKGFSHITNVLRCPLCMDVLTKEGTRLEFAWLCIEIGVNREFPNLINIAPSNRDMKAIKSKVCLETFML